MSSTKSALTDHAARPPVLLHRLPTVLAGSALIALVSLYGYVVLCTAWLGDDAYFTFRTIDNWLNGYGLTWNVAERVQAYTHPLWMLLLAGICALTGESPIYYSVIFTSIALSLAAVLVMAARIARSRPRAILGTMILLWSKAFVDFSTSGLENPLSYLLVAAFLAAYLRAPPMNPRQLGWLSLLTCLAALTRIDLLLLLAPTLAWAFWPRRSRKTLATVLLGFAPLLGWEIFSLIYYGFLVPNTAYAKLCSGLPATDLARQGLYYLLNAVREDTLTPAMIVAGTVAALASRQRRYWPLVLGIGLYVLYIVRIGGDFMSGRFLTLPLLAGVAMLVTLPLTGRRGAIAWIAAMLAVGAIGLSGRNPPLLRLQDYGQTIQEPIDPYGIADERGWYEIYTALFRSSTGLSRSLPNHRAAYEGTAASQQPPSVLAAQIAGGFYGYFAGPRVHVVDIHALADPLLSHLPTMWLTGWRPGHFLRAIPDGYLEGLRSGDNGLTDKDLHAFYDTIRRITRGPLFTANRWRAILGMNLGLYDDLIHADFYRRPPMRIRATDLESPKAAGSPCDAPGNTRMPATGIIIHFYRIVHPAALDISLDGRHTYVIAYPQKAGDTLEQILPTSPAAGMAVHPIQVPPAATREGFDRVYVYPRQGDDQCTIGHIRLAEDQP